MANPAVTNTFANSTTADATQVNTNFQDIIDSLTDGTKSLSIDALTCAGTATLNGAVTLGNGTPDDITWTGSLASTIPIKTTYSYDFGSSTIGLKSVYLGSSDSAARTTRIIGATVASSWTLTLPTGGGTSGYVLSTDGNGSTSWARTGSHSVPTIQSFTSTGTTTGYLFTVTSANATVGATYTNNGNTYTVLGTISSGTELFCSQSAAPQASGTLTKASGTGDATITFSAAVAAGTYTTPSSPSPTYIRVRMVGGGASGSGGGNGGGTGSAGNSSYFGANLLKGTRGAASSGGAQNGGVGGTPTIGAGATGIALPGGTGDTAVVNTQAAGGSGGATAFGGAGYAGGGAARANTGAGGGGGHAGTGGAGGGGGGAGGYIDAIITSLDATYPYIVGAAQSTVGSAGTGGAAGGAGAAGYIEVTEYYQ